MFKERQEGMVSAHAGNQTIIAQGVRVEGDFHSDGDVIIDGEVSGSLKTKKALQIGESARIEANVVAASAIVAGEIQGNIHTDDRLELLATSVVNGDIDTGLISVAPGARINGRVTMSGSTPATRLTKEGVKEEEEETEE